MKVFKISLFITLFILSQQYKNNKLFSSSNIKSTFLRKQAAPSNTASLVSSSLKNEKGIAQTTDFNNNHPLYNLNIENVKQFGGGINPRPEYKHSTSADKASAPTAAPASKPVAAPAAK